MSSYHEIMLNCYYLFTKDDDSDDFLFNNKVLKNADQFPFHYKHYTITDIKTAQDYFEDIGDYNKSKELEDILYEKIQLN